MNEDIVELIRKAAETAKITDVNKGAYRSQALIKAASIIEDLDYEITDADELQGIPGIGKGTIERVKEILETSNLKEIKDRTEILSEELQKIQGIGVKTAMKLINKGVSSIDDLIEKVNNEEISLTDEQLIGIEYYKDFEKRIPRKEVRKMGNLVITSAKEINPLIKGRIVGSYRRKSETSGDVDILFVNSGDDFLETLINDLIEADFIQHIFDQGKVKFSGTYFSDYPKNDGILRKIDINITPANRYGAALLHHTGSGDFNIGLRKIAMTMDLSLSQYGLKNKEGKYLKTKTEQDVFDKLGIYYVKPEDRN